MKFIEILVWLVIFIVGSLIVTFLVSPNSFDNFKYNIKSLIPERQNIQEESSININTLEETGLEIKETKKEEIKEVENEYEEISLDYWNSCAGLELSAQIDNIGEEMIKEKYCVSLCGRINLEYGYFTCVTDKLYCYCLK